MKRLLVLLFLTFACQPLPKDVPLEKYRNQFIEGEVYVDKNLASKLPKGERFLIISVRDAESPAPLAVLKVKNPEFPYRFKITGKHKLRHDRIMEGQVFITARISQSDSAELKKGDLLGTATAQVGTRGVRILINTEVN